VLASAIAAVLVVCGAVGAVAVLRRDGGADARSRAPTTAGTKRTTATTSATTVMSAPATTSAPFAASSAPTAFTVHATCGGRDCTVVVHQGSTTSTARVGSLRSGETTQVSCSTHGEAVTDRDTGQRSDVWYRLADGRGYASALYLQGPTVADCG
jgi:hypothetical protein